MWSELVKGSVLHQRQQGGVMTRAAVYQAPAEDESFHLSDEEASDISENESSSNPSSFMSSSVSSLEASSFRLCDWYMRLLWMG